MPVRACSLPDLLESLELFHYCWIELVHGCWCEIELLNVASMEAGRVCGCCVVAAHSVVAIIHGWNRRSRWGCMLVSCCHGRIREME